MTRYRGRFAPSPTGPLHFGSLVAAVGSFLDARAQGGEWLVRIEDVDRPRVVEGSIDDILLTLEACGMAWDGPLMHQSARDDAYHAALHDLKSKAALYPCACSRREIADSAVSGIDGYVYPGTCRGGLAASRAARCWRVLTQGTRIGFDDLVQGRVEHDLEKDIGDFVIYRADHLYAYQLAVVIDDAEQGITHVVRGADLLDSTPRQIHLQRLLGFPTPRYAHLPVAVNDKGEKLSKQTLATPVDRAHAGHALVQALRFLGQPLPAGLEAAGVSEIWAWAFGNWDIGRVPRRRALAAP